MVAKRIQKRIWRSRAAPSHEELLAAREACISGHASKARSNDDFAAVAANAVQATDSGVSAEAVTAALTQLKRGTGKDSASSSLDRENGIDGEERPEWLMLERHRKINFDLEMENHYILVIHGTFDAPVAGEVKWYESNALDPTNFCTALANAFALVGPQSAANGNPVWRPLPAPLPPELQSCYPFHWDGTNTHAGRLAAAEKLAKLFHFIGTTDPSARIHVVAHSHGGNVLLKATEIYMRDLARSSDSKWHPTIRHAFWSAYRNQHKLAFRWRRHKSYATIPWYRKLWPFLVLYRTITGEKTRGCEAYPFAYYKWFDSLLGLGFVRQNIYLRHRKASSPVSNALGSLIFLGTPFFVKRWGSGQKLLFFVSILIESLIAGMLMYAYVSFWYFIFVAGHLVAPQITGNIIVGVTFVMVVFIASVLLAFSEVVFRGGNIYHNQDLKWSSAMSTLVAHAGVLDEASMGLSAEPLVEATLVPKLQELMEAPVWRSWPAKPEAWNVFTTVFYLFKLAYSLYINGMGLVPFVHRWIIKVLAPFFGASLRKMIMSIALGLKSKDLSYGKIFVERELSIPNAGQIQHWNTQRLIAAHKTTASFRLQSTSTGEEITSGTRASTPTPQSLAHTKSKTRLKWDGAKSAVFSRLRIAGSFRLPSMTSSRSEPMSEQVNSPPEPEAKVEERARGDGSREGTPREGASRQLMSRKALEELQVEVMDTLEEGDSDLAMTPSGGGATGGGRGSILPFNSPRHTVGMAAERIQMRLTEAAATAVEAVTEALEDAGNGGLRERESIAMRGEGEEKTGVAGLGRAVERAKKRANDAARIIKRTISPPMPKLSSPRDAASSDKIGKGPPMLDHDDLSHLPSDAVVVPISDQGSFLNGGSIGQDARQMIGTENGVADGSFWDPQWPHRNSTSNDSAGDAGRCMSETVKPVDARLSGARRSRVNGATQKREEGGEVEGEDGWNAAGGNTEGSRATVGDIVAAVQADRSDVELSHQGLREGKKLKQRLQSLSSTDEAGFGSPARGRVETGQPLLSISEGPSGSIRLTTAGGAEGAGESVSDRGTDTEVSKNLSIDLLPDAVDRKGRPEGETSAEAFARHQAEVLDKLEREERAERGTAVMPGKEYSFLWDERELDELASKSAVFAQLQGKMGSLQRNPDLSQEQFEAELKRICVMFERRLAEVTGHYEFSHSIYYKNRMVVNALAHFLVTWDLPDWADEHHGVSDSVRITT